MKLAAAFLLALATSWLSGATSAIAADAKPQLHCITGPVEKTYGGSKWLVHSCTDGKSLVFTAQAGAAAPFEFDLTFTGNGYDLDGKGKGNRKATDAAYTDLQKLRAADILKLIKETQAVKPKG